MAQKKKKKGPVGNIVAQNRKARHDYTIVDHLEAGLQLMGTEVKSLRQGRASLVDAFAAEKDGELYLQNAHIAEYTHGTKFGHEPLRARKLLLHRKQLANLLGAVRRKGMSLVPLSIYFNPRGIAKVDLALAEGKRQYDKRASERDKSWGREKARLLRAKG